jgi:CubicO group peptidase (beta-lactamase class C family)
LMSRVPIADRMHAPVHASRGAAASSPRSSLEGSLRKMLEDMVKADALLGIQVCVWKGRSFQVDVAAGRMGQLDPRPVTPKSLFPCFSVSRLATAAVVNSFVSSGITRMYAYNLSFYLDFVFSCVRCLLGVDAGFTDTVASVWQPFSAGGKQAVTVSDFLKCRSGVEGALPAILSTYSSFSSAELDTIAAQIAERPYQILGEHVAIRLMLTLPLFCN